MSFLAEVRIEVAVYGLGRHSGRALGAYVQLPDLASLPLLQAPDQAAVRLADDCMMVSMSGGFRVVTKPILT
jgi:hypothetical protein